jgi:hypothetical protein
LSDQEPDADSAHVEAIEPVLDLPRRLERLTSGFAAGGLPFEDSLCDRGDRGVVPSLDALQRLGEALVVFEELWRE